jgi:hypothetical protein
MRDYPDFCNKYQFAEERPEGLAPFVEKLQQKRQSPE